MTALWLFLKGIPAWVWLLILIVAAGLAYGQFRFGAGKAEVQAQFDIHLAADKAATEAFNAETKAKDAAQAEAIAQIGFRYEREKADALDKQAAVIADLRDGTLKLRQQWRCPASPMSDAAEGAGNPDDAADLRNTDAGNLIGISAACDTQVRGLQAILTKERE
jgi:hypothetical protein